MNIEITSWKELRDEIKELFFNSKFITNPDDVFQSLIDIVNEIEKNQNDYVESQKKLIKYLMENHRHTSEFWLTYLSGARAKLFDLSFVNKNGEEMEDEDVLEILKTNNDNVAKQVSIIIRLSQDRVMELNN